MTHCRLAAVNPRSRWIDGSATFTTVASRITMNCARQTMTRTSQRLVSPDEGGSTKSSERSEATPDTATSGGWGAGAADLRDDPGGATERIKEPSAIDANICSCIQSRFVKQPSS